MGKLEREIRKRMKQSAEPYEVWAQKHSDELAEIAAKQESQTVDVGGAVKAKRRIPNFAWLIGAGIVLLTLILTISILLSRNASQTQIPSQPQIPDLSFGDESVAAVPMTEEEADELIAQMKYLGDLENKHGTKFIHHEDNSIVMVLVSGELETANDFYLIEAKIVYNDNFIFLDKWEYDELKEEAVIGDTEVHYQAKGTDEFGLNIFLAVTQTDTEKVFWKISCIEGLFDEWLEETFS